MTPALVIFLTVAAPLPKLLVPDADAVMQRLRERYPLRAVYTGRELSFLPDTKLVEIDAPALRRADPGLRLFRTTLCTMQWCYWDVEVAVAAWVEKGRVETAEYLSPVYGDSSPGFARRLRALRGKTAADREAISRDVCDVFRRITYRGKIVEGRLAGDEYRAGLMHGDQLWRQVRLTFDAEGALSGVELTNPREPRGK